MRSRPARCSCWSPRTFCCSGSGFTMAALHWSEIATGWPRYGADPRFDRWLTLSTLTGVVVVFGLLGAVLRHRPLPLHGSARFASEREIKAAGLRSKEGMLLGRKDGALLVFRRIGTRPGLRPDPRRQGRRLGHSESAQLAGFRRCARREEGELGSLGGISRRPWSGGPSVRPARGERSHRALQSAGLCRAAIPADLYDDLQRIAVMLFPAREPRRSVLVRGRPVGLCRRSAAMSRKRPGLPFDDRRDLCTSCPAAPDLKTTFRRRSSPPQVRSFAAVAALHHGA